MAALLDGVFLSLCCDNFVYLFHLSLNDVLMLSRSLKSVGPAQFLSSGYVLSLWDSGVIPWNTQWRLPWRSMEQLQLLSKCFSRGGNLETPCCQEFTVSHRSGVPFWGILTFVVLLCGVFLKFECLEKRTCRPQDVALVSTLVFIFIAYLVIYLTTVQKETLLLVMPLGLQMTTVTRLGKQDTTWIPWCLLANFMILDVIVGQKVIFCLAVSVKNSVDGQEKTLILFRNTKPRLNQLETIYRELQTSLDKYRW